MPGSYALKTKITLVVAAFSLALVILVSALSHHLINRKFVEYIARQQQEKTEELLLSLSSQYYVAEGAWDMSFLHTIGMYALYDGFIITVSDSQGDEVWDALTHDMSACYQVMEDIQRRMEKKYPSMDGEFVLASYPLEQGGTRVGEVRISYYGPYFLSENDFDFLKTLDKVLVVIALMGLAVSILLGRYVAGRISRPILRAVDAAGQMMDGNYDIGLGEATDIRELNRLTGSINHLAASLEKQELLRRQLTADVAHELRTPLTAMGTHMEAMIEGVWEPTPQRLQSCYEEIGRLSTLVRDLESLARVESDNLQLNIAQIDGWALVDRALEHFAMEFRKKRLRLEKRGEELTLRGDPDRLLQVLHNLLSNAVKYTPEDGMVRVGLRREGEYALLSVEDTGSGISPEDLPYIFERFYRADKSRNRATGGSGIGLSIVRSIVAAHGGEITVDSKPGQGSAFVVALPVK